MRNVEALWGTGVVGLVAGVLGFLVTGASLSELWSDMSLSWGSFLLDMVSGSLVVMLSFAEVVVYVGESLSKRHSSTDGRVVLVDSMGVERA